DHIALASAADHFNADVHIGRLVVHRLDDDAAFVLDLVGVGEFEDEVDGRRNILEPDLEAGGVRLFDRDVDRSGRLVRRQNADTAGDVQVLVGLGHKDEIGACRYV